MRRLIPPLITIGLGILLALLSAAMTYSSPSRAQNALTDSAYFLQTTPTPQQQEDRSEVGSTDEIIIMGGVIALIVVVPILLRRKSWR